MNQQSAVCVIYIFAGCIDACILATLAFILATRHVRLQPEPMYQNSMFKGNLNAHHIHIRVHFHSIPIFKKKTFIYF